MIDEVAENAIIIALDGATDPLMAFDIKPDIILGDLDSISAQAQHSGIQLISIHDQNLTDLQKGIRWAKQNATSIHVVCALGGRMDHELSNMQTLLSEYSLDCPIYLYNEYQTLFVAKNQEVMIQGLLGDYCGFFGAPEASMSVKNGGLAYGGETPYFLSQTQWSSSNQLIGNQGAVVEINGSAFIVHPPMLKAQRDAFINSKHL